jgi:hypothetical protein
MICQVIEIDCVTCHRCEVMIFHVDIADHRLECISVVRRTVIVEPYSAPASSRIIVKSRVDLLDKILREKQ